ncbi:hypothetical protein ACIP46_17405 [Streptomyces lavendulae]|uniref:hypothetical protein n=1 Tax=Streptomyces lavendulae TaxID=1914 RepID=UPI0037F2D1F4
MGKIRGLLEAVRADGERLYGQLMTGFDLAIVDEAHGDRVSRLLLTLTLPRSASARILLRVVEGGAPDGFPEVAHAHGLVGWVLRALDPAELRMEEHQDIAVLDTASGTVRSVACSRAASVSSPLPATRSMSTSR